jgi:putative DNA primase/helicase
MPDPASHRRPCGCGLGLEDGSIQRALDDNQRAASHEAFENDPVAVAIAALVDAQSFKRWTGTPTELLRAIAPKTSDSEPRARNWPITAQTMGNWLNRHAPVLRACGLDVSRRHSEQRFIEITRNAEQ